MKELSATDLAWLAGFVDGEGCIRLNLTGPARCTPYLSLWTKHYETMQGVASMVGVELKERKTKPGWSNVYGFQLTGDRALGVIRAIRPYIRTKAQEVWLLLEALAQSPKRTGNLDKLTEEDKALRVGYSLALQYAKSVGA